MRKTIKASEYGKFVGLNHRTIVKHINKGILDGYKDINTGRYYVYTDNNSNSTGLRTILYSRVSSKQNEASLTSQIERLRDYAAAKGYVITKEVKEIASGVNDKRPLLLSILKSKDWDILLVEHKDRLTRFGFNYIDTLINKTSQRIEVINEQEVKTPEQELLEDFVSIVTSFCGRLYGKNRKQKTEQIINMVKQND